MESVLIRTDLAHGDDVEKLNDQIAAERQRIEADGEASAIFAKLEAAARKRSDAAGGLLFTEAEIGEFNEINAELGLPAWDVSKLAQA